MGKITVRMRIRNLFDEVRAKEGLIKPEQIREITVENALVDTGATMLSLPIDLIERLGLEEAGKRIVKTANGMVTRRVFRGAWIEIEGREGEFMVLELPVDVSPLIGQVVLEELDLHPDPQSRKLRGRPDSPDKMVVECYML